jgi:hypothetical protein
MEETLPELRGQLRMRRREDVALAAVHEVRFGGITVVVAHEVEDAVGDQELELQIQRDAQSACLAPGRFDRDHDLADEPPWGFRNFQGEGQDVRPPPDPPEGPIEAPDLHVVDERDIDAVSLTPNGAERALGGADQSPEADGNAVLAILDDWAH